MDKTEDTEWTIVKSKHEKILEKKIQKEISSKNTEIGIMGNHKVFFGDKLILNNEILKSRSMMSYIKNNCRINKKLTDRLSTLDLASIENKFKKQDLDLETFTCISYPYKLGKLYKLEGDLTHMIHGWKISLKDKDVYQILLLFRTDIQKLPYAFVRYIQTKNNIIKKECIAVNNYIEVLLFIYRHELNLVLKKKTLVNDYPINFIDINKEHVNTYFIGFRKIRKDEPLVSDENNLKIEYDNKEDTKKND
jgi:hypothetical protein